MYTYIHYAASYCETCSLSSGVEDSVMRGFPEIRALVVATH